MKNNHNSSRPQMVNLFLRATALGAITYLGIKMAVKLMDPTNTKKRKAKDKVLDVLSKLGIGFEGLNEYEAMIASDLLIPESIGVMFADVAGLDNIIEELKIQVILPLRYPSLFKGDLRQPPRGVLFHGPPGCGKTMLAKAIAREANVRFLNLNISALTDKWYGESLKLAQAVFTLASKIQPCIIFIDEIDSFLRSRDSHDHEATAMMKAQFMTLWEGIVSSKRCQVVLIGATNRPQDIDMAVLRRMPCVFKIDLPKENERHEILKIILKQEKLMLDVNLVEIAKLTEGYSGSDLKDLCRRAAMRSLKELNGSLLRSSKVESYSSRSSSRSTVNQLKQPDPTVKSHKQNPLSSLLSSSISNHVEKNAIRCELSSSNTLQFLTNVKLSGSRKFEFSDITMDDFLHSIECINASRTGIKTKESRIPLG